MKYPCVVEKLFCTLPEKTGRCLAPFVLLLLRVVWGWQLTEAGWAKLHAIEKTAGFFAKLGIPAPELNAILAGTVECAGGALLIVGLASRLVSIPLLFTMIVAAIAAEKDSFIGTADKPVEGIEHVTKFFDTTPGPFIVALLIIFAFGAGRFSLDGIIARCGGAKEDGCGGKSCGDKSGALPAKPLE